MWCVVTDGKCNKDDPALSLAFALAKQLQLSVDELFML